MTQYKSIAELLTENPGVNVSLRFNGDLGIFLVTASRGVVNFLVTVSKWAEDKEPGLLQKTIKRAVEVVK